MCKCWVVFLSIESTIWNVKQYGFPFISNFVLFLSLWTNQYRCDIWKLISHMHTFEHRTDRNKALKLHLNFLTIWYPTFEIYKYFTYTLFVLIVLRLLCICCTHRDTRKKKSHDELLVLFRRRRFFLLQPVHKHMHSNLLLLSDKQSIWLVAVCRVFFSRFFFIHSFINLSTEFAFIAWIFIICTFNAHFNYKLPIILHTACLSCALLN